MEMDGNGLGIISVYVLLLLYMYEMLGREL